MGKIGRVRAVIIPSICLPLLAACDSQPQIAPDIGAHRFGESFSTPEGGKMEMIEERVLVSFLELVEDSRCPKLLDVAPHPETTQQIGSAQYSVTLRVTTGE